MTSERPNPCLAEPNRIRIRFLANRTEPNRNRTESDSVFGRIRFGIWPNPIWYLAESELLFGRIQVPCPILLNSASKHCLNLLSLAVQS